MGRFFQWRKKELLCRWDSAGICREWSEPLLLQLQESLHQKNANRAEWKIEQLFKAWSSLTGSTSASDLVHWSLENLSPEERLFLEELPTYKKLMQRRTKVA